MNILVSGCSHSEFVPTDKSRLVAHGYWTKDLKDTYSYKLESYEGIDRVDNVSCSAKDNANIFHDAIKFCIMAGDIDVLVLQLTEFSRICFHKFGTEWDPHKPFDYIKNWIKFNPSCYSHKERPSIKFDAAVDGVHEWQTGSQKNIYEEMDVLIRLISLQDFCRQRNIKLVILNYVPFLNTHKYDASITSQIDFDAFIINRVKPDAPQQYKNIISYLDGKGFKYPLAHVGDCHFGPDAHDHLAEIIYNKIMTGDGVTAAKPKQKSNPIYKYDV
jgi:hypothetical protein